MPGEMISVVIPNWNGKDLLKKNLPLVVNAVGKDIEIIIVDDASTDQSQKYIKDNFPFVELVVHSRNLGFGAACNTGVEKAKGKFVVLLNSDVVPKSGFLKPAIVHFSNPRVFAVTFNEGGYGPGKLVWKKGFLEIVATSPPLKTSVTDWPNGGTSIFRKDVWTFLKGLDCLFLPFYFEDIDLGIRASKKGFVCLFEPKAKVEHMHETTINEKNFRLNYINSIKQRNHLLLTWRNINSFSRLADHVLNLFKKCFLTPGYIKIVFLAGRRLAGYTFGKK